MGNEGSKTTPEGKPDGKKKKSKKRISNSQLQPSEMTMGDLDVLPTEIIYEILGHVNTQELLKTAAVSKTWRLYVGDIFYLKEGSFAGSKITEEVFLTILERHQGIEYLNISVCSNLSTDAVREGLKNCSRLQELILYGWNGVQYPEFLEHMAACCPALTHLDVSYVAKPEQAFPVISKMKNLRKLTMNEIEYRNYAAALTLHSESLQILRLENIEQWRAENLTLDTPNLTSLSVADTLCSELALATIVSSCPKLKVLNVNRASCMTFFTAKTAERFPELEHIICHTRWGYGDYPEFPGFLAAAPSLKFVTASQRDAMTWKAALVDKDKIITFLA